MDTSALAPLAHRWPHDQVITPANPGFEALGRILENSSTVNFYASDFRFDENDGAAIAAFGQANGLTYARNAPPAAAIPGAQLPAWIGFRVVQTAPIGVHQLTGQILGHNARMWVEYVPAMVQENTTITEAGRAMTPVRLKGRSLIAVDLPKTFPQLVLDSNKNDRGITSSIPTTIEADQKISLEGDFANYFDFYVPRGLHINALTVLAPNFMQILKDSAATFDVEFYGNQLILVTNDPIYTPEVMTEAMQALEAELKYLDRLAASWNYEPTVQPFDQLVYPFVNGELTKIGKLRITPGVMVTVIFGAFGLIWLFAMASGLLMSLFQA